MLIAQISDLHVSHEGALIAQSLDAGASLARAIDRLNALDPRADLVLATGDLVNSGAVYEYQRLRALLSALAIPVYLIPGNHDSRAALRQVFPDHAYLSGDGEFMQYEIAGYPIRLIALDTLDEGHEEGLLDTPRLDWLKQRLDHGRDTATIVFMHHPPFATGIGHMDLINCRGAEQLEGIIRRHPHVERLLCGHVHRPVQTRWAGTLAAIAPSTAHQINLDLRVGQPPGQYILEPPGFLLHLWRPGLGLVSHTILIDDFPGPYGFDG